MMDKTLQEKIIGYINSKNIPLTTLKRYIERYVNIINHNKLNSLFIGFDVTGSIKIKEDTALSEKEKKELGKINASDKESPFHIMYARFKRKETDPEKYGYTPEVVHMVLPINVNEVHQYTPMEILAHLMLGVIKQLDFMGYLADKKNINASTPETPKEFNSLADLLSYRLNEEALSDTQIHYLGALVAVYAYVERTVTLLSKDNKDNKELFVRQLAYIAGESDYYRAFAIHQGPNGNLTFDSLPPDTRTEQYDQLLALPPKQSVVDRVRTG